VGGFEEECSWHGGMWRFWIGFGVGFGELVCCFVVPGSL
jgi:hypothetical protein